MPKLPNFSAGDRTAPDLVAHSFLTQYEFGDSYLAQTTRQKEAAVSLDPATGEEIADSEVDLNRSLQMTEAGFEQWPATSPDARAQTLSRIATAIRRNLASLALMATREMGKPITQSRAEVEKCAAVCDWYAEHGPAMLADEPTSIEDDKAYVSYLPIRGVLAVMPWNFPYWQVMRGAMPIILGGNAYVLKHTPNVMGLQR